MLEKSNKIIISDSSVHGRGVFAIETIDAGETLEECHYIVLQNSNIEEIDRSLRPLVFCFPKYPSSPANLRFAVVLGSGTVYNSSKEPSADWEIDKEKNCFRFFAIRRIEIGEEIFTNYGID